ncbi:hypothetical protein [Nitrosococcus oceani]|uniref:Uncharacterized protein n=2 Tax=Nitrosococcus oceani TaxID=1229 RepID=Q3JEU4_NITOC|nr:hypothetical protein [Nitrosococcus oceani]KFI20898.1 hypothetical protein IB75_00550 [Nitrosococcus oceani C-27]ABA56652.1 hypothetical protein Noc_0119 [Nitrosococcus oceani ATCC 19707]EDZ66666.1 hypothetical protein NOC27_3346 [Nitrosococcus oceani AFC27]KFI23981.1 hypothetical protein HW44_00540 [Nitrosococcus oceani]GEM20778.1 hypothetical protein NONS58_22000 [Nitrosococcus oceani]
MDIAKKFLPLPWRAQFLAFAALTVFALPLHAESGEAPSLTPAQMQEFHKLQQKMRTVGQQLDEIRQETLKTTPKLQEQQEEYQSLLFKTMKEQGSDPDPALARMREIEGQVQNEDLPEDERKQFIMEYQQKDAQLQQASRDAMQDEKVRKMAESLSQDTVAAMREQDPKTEELLREMEQLREEMQGIVAKIKPKPQAGSGSSSE